MSDLKINLKKTESSDQESLTKEEDIDKGVESTSSAIPDEKPKIKLNLKAMNLGDTNTQETDIIEEDREISQNTEKEDTSSEIIEETDQPETEVTQTSEAETHSQVEEEKENSGKGKISLSSIKSGSSQAANSNTQEEEGTEAEPLPEVKKNVETNEKMFGNYESHFEKKSQNFMDKLRNLKTTPKTRLGFLFFLICITIIVIGGLMYLVPEKHSFIIYKGAIIEIYNTKIKKVSPTSTPTPQPKGATPKNTQEEKIQTPPKTQEERIDSKEQKVKDFLLENYKK